MRNSWKAGNFATCWNGVRSKRPRFIQTDWQTFQHTDIVKMLLRWYWRLKSTSPILTVFGQLKDIVTTSLCANFHIAAFYTYRDLCDQNFVTNDGISRQKWKYCCPPIACFDRLRYFELVIAIWYALFSHLQHNHIVFAFRIHYPTGNFHSEFFLHVSLPLNYIPRRIREWNDCSFTSAAQALSHIPSKRNEFLGAEI